MSAGKKNQLVELTRKDLGRISIFHQHGRRLQGAKGPILDYASTNYLGWDFRPELLEQGVRRHREWGSLAGWSRLELDPDFCRDLESRLAGFIGCPDTILSHTITISGFSLIPAIAGKGLVLCDQKVHTVIWEACRLARDHGAKLAKFAHQNAADADRLLREHEGPGPKLICVDGVYSISGEYAPIRELQEVCRRHGAWLVVDDAHGFGILGTNDNSSAYGRLGNGVVNFAGGDFARTFYLSSAGKAFCTHTAFITVPSEFPEPLREQCMQYIYSAPPSPFVLGMVEAALQLNEREGEVQRRRLLDLTSRFVDGLRGLGLDVQNHARFPIVFWRVGELHALMEAAGRLFANGVVAGLRAFPVVPPDQCGMRFGVTALHSEEQIDETLTKISEVAKFLKSSHRAG